MHLFYFTALENQAVRLSQARKWLFHSLGTVDDIVADVVKFLVNEVVSSEETSTRESADRQRHLTARKDEVRTRAAVTLLLSMPMSFKTMKLVLTQMIYRKSTRSIVPSLV